LFERWMQETRRFKPSTACQVDIVVAGYYRTCVIDGFLDHHRASTCAARPRRRSQPQPWA
jgi:hypothetical protein